MKKNQFLFGLIIIPFLFSATPALAEESQEKTSQVQGKEIKNQSILENIELPKKINNQDDLKQTEIAPKAMITGDRPFESMEKLDVDPASGTASASIPLQVPRGRGGVEPALALAYNSGSSNGLLGVGWFLDLGKIGRSTKFGIPAYTDEDTFVLMQSGSRQELVDISSNATEFRPETEGSFMKIEFINNDYWLATDRKGIKYYFGQTDDSRVVDPDDASRVFEWALDYVEDLYGNYMTIFYTKESNHLYPHFIRYTGNSFQQNMDPFAEIEFVLEDRTDKQIRFISGFSDKVEKRIKQILVKVDNNLQRQYSFDYVESGSTQRSLLLGVTQSGDDGTSQLRPTTFEYQNQDEATELSFGDIELDPNSTGDNKWTYRFNGGYDHGHCNYGPAPPPDMYFGVDWGPKQLVGDDYGNFSLSGQQDSANWHWTYLYVEEDTTLTVPFINYDGNPGIWLNGNITPSNSIWTTWNLKAGYNRIDMTNYHQHSSFGFNLNFDLANHVFSMNSDRITPKFAADFNGDGLDDIANFDDETGEVKVALSQGNAFSQQETWIDNFGQDKKMFLGDFNSDALIDVGIFNKDNGSWRVALSDGTQFIDDGLWKENFGAGKEHSTGDFNGDGFTDIVIFYKSSGNYYAKIALNNKQNGFEEWTELNPIVAPEDTVPFAVDFNSDGLTDFGAFKRSNGHWVIKLNTGNLANQFLEIFNETGFGNEKSLGVADFNSDGFVDIGYYDHNDKRIKYRTFNADGFRSEITELPKQYGLDGPYVQIQSGDFNGDGAKDFIVCSYIGHFEAALSKTKANDLMLEINNGIGGVTTVEYESSAYQENIFLPFAVQTVKSITTDNSLGDSYTVEYERSDGLWDVASREFRGFGRVKTIDPDNNYSESYFFQDDIFKGRPQKQETYDAAGNLYAKVENTWDYQEIYPGVNFVYLKEKNNFIFNGNATGRRTQEKYFYDESPQLGNLTKSIQLGEVDVVTGDDIPGDTRTTESEYFNNTDGENWLIGIPKRTLSKNNDGELMRQSWFYYDGDESQSTLPILGALTKKEQWNEDVQGGEKNIVIRYEYDFLGNLKKTIDPKGHQSVVTYDEEYFFFPLEVENDLGHKVKKYYYGISGVPLDDGEGYHGLWGQTKQVEDSNNQQGRKTYDAFGRLIATVSPLDSIDFPTSIMEYELTDQYVKIKSKKRMKHGQSQTMDTAVFYDGLGREIQTKTKAEDSGVYIVSGHTEYNLRGLPIKKYLPFCSTVHMDEVDPIDPNRLKTIINYDAMGRVVKTINPDGTYSTISYDDWVTTAIDENGHKQAAYTDAFGRLIKKEEYFGADGRSPDYLQSSYSLYATTLYSYDSEGNLTQVEDALGNITSIFYNVLGQKVLMDDPDMGVWEYQYDPAGNLVLQKDALGQIVEFEYDELNRLINKADGTDLNVDYIYDDLSVNYSKGRLTKAQYLEEDNTSFVYDAIGREVESVKQIGQTQYSVQRDYDALSRIKSVLYPQQEEIYYDYNVRGQIKSVSEILPTQNVYWMDSPFLQFKMNDDGDSTVTKFIANFDGEDGATAYTAETGQVINFEGTAQLDIVQSKIGESSLLLDGSSGYVTVPDSDDFNFGAGDFTVDFWVRFNLLSEARFVGQRDDSNNYWTIRRDSEGKIHVTFFMDGVYQGAYKTVDNVLIAENSWQHIAVVRSGTTCKIFVDGISADLITMISFGTNDVGDVASSLCIGAFNGAGWYNGHIDGIRITKGEALWTDNFIPSTFNNVSAAAVVDYGTGDNNGIANTDTLNLSAPGKINNALEFESINSDHINIDTLQSEIRNDTVGAFSLWVKPDSTGWQSRNKFLAFGDADTFQYLGIFGFENRLMVFVQIDGSNYMYWQCASGTLTEDWQHISVVQDGISLKIYRNGINITPAPTSLGSVEASDWLAAISSIDNGRIGCINCDNLGDSFHYDGLIDDVRYYKFALTPAEVLALYNNGEGTEDENPYVYESRGSGLDGEKFVLSDYAKNIVYNQYGQMLSMEYGNGVITTYQHDELSLRLKNIHAENSSGEVIQDLSYTYDSAGNITKIIDSVHTGSRYFQYDELNRLTQAILDPATPNQQVLSYAYNEIGNILEKDGLTFSYGENGAGPHAVTSLSDGTTFDYNENGNMVEKVDSDGTVWSYSYDVENRLKEVRKNLVLKAQYEYDGDGGRVKKTTYDAQMAIIDHSSNLPKGKGFHLEEFGRNIEDPSMLFSTANAPKVTKFIGSLYEEQGSVPIRYIYLGGQRIAQVRNDEVTYYHVDHLGGTNLLTDDTGVVKELCEYKPFGGFFAHEKYGNNQEVALFYFTGKGLDEETGLYYYGARYYNPIIGRFITADSKVVHSSDPQDLNRYAYCRNNPINNIDPDGHGWWKKLWKSLVHAFRHPFDIKWQWNDFWSQAKDSVISGATAFVFSGFNPVVGISAMLTTYTLSTPPGKQLTEWVAKEIYDDMLGFSPKISYILASIDLNMTGTFLSERVFSNMVGNPVQIKDGTQLSDADYKKLKEGYFYGDEHAFGPSLKTEGRFTRDQVKGLFQNGEFVGSSQKYTLDIPFFKQIGAQHTSANVLNVSADKTLNPYSYATWGTCHQATNATLLKAGISFTILDLGVSWDMYVTTAVYGNYGGQLGTRIWAGAEASNNY